MKKTRLTITISPEILKEIDKLVDGQTIRNRSHAIETLIVRELTGSVSQAVILVGGTPEAAGLTLTKVAGQPVLVHLLNLVESHGLKEIFVLTDTTNPEIEAICTARSNVKLIEQQKSLGTAGSIKDIESLLNPSPFLVIHGDIFTDVNIHDLIKFHETQNRLCTICVKPKLNQKEFGKAILHGNRITEFSEKPDASEVALINTGVYIIDPKILESIKPKTRSMLERDVLPTLAKSNQLSGFPFEGIWYALSPER